MVHELLNRALRRSGASGGLPPEIASRLAQLEERVRSGIGAPISAGVQVATALINDLAVTTAKLNDGAVTDVKVGAGAAIALSKLASMPAFILHGRHNPPANMGAGTAHFAPLTGYSEENLTAEDGGVRFIAPFAMTLRNLRARNEAVLNTNQTLEIAVVKAGSATNLAATWGATAAANTEVSDLTDSVSLAAGDLATISLTPAVAVHSAGNRIAWTIQGAMV